MVCLISWMEPVCSSGLENQECHLVGSSAYCQSSTSTLTDLKIQAVISAKTCYSAFSRSFSDFRFSLIKQFLSLLILVGGMDSGTYLFYLQCSTFIPHRPATCNDTTPVGGVSLCAAHSVVWSVVQ